MGKGERPVAGLGDIITFRRIGVFSPSLEGEIERGWNKNMSAKISNLSSVRTQRRKLRTNATPQEVILWSRLKNRQLGVKFRRQHSFGEYIADFYCPEKRLVVEVDGSQHMEQEKYDTERTKFFESFGLKILRFWNNEINANVDGVMMKIQEYVQ